MNAQLWNHILYIGLVSLSIQGQQIPAPGQPFSITINCPQPPVSLNNVVNNNPQIHTETNQNQDNKQSSNTLQNLRHQWAHLYPDLASINNWTSAFIQHNTKRIIIATIIGWITYLLYYLKTMSSFVAPNTHHWCTWRINDTPPLCEQAFENDLLIAIQTTYYNMLNPLDSTHAISSFSLEIQKEERILRRYITVCTIIQSMYLDKLPGIIIKQQEAEKVLHNLTTIAKRFFTWLAINKSTLLFNT